MVTAIDHAIAIPTRPANVWEQIRDITKNPIWQVNCKQVQFLTSNRNGRGTRWRSTNSRGKEQVIEITAWYEGLGYEYRIVDGASFSSNRGRIRLQDSLEGTIVQWTFSYELKGFMSGLRNALTIKGSVDGEIVDGLRNLYTHIKNLKVDEPLVPEESKSYLKVAPDVTARQQYQPRYPSVLDSKPDNPIVPSQEPLQQAQIVPNIVEPPVAADDTEPNPSVKPIVEIPVSKPEADEMFKPKAIQAQELPRLDEPIEIETASSPKPATIDTSPVPTMQEKPVSPAVEEWDVSKLDTAKISVFEVFGLEKPSETEKVFAISEKPAESALSVSFRDQTPIKPDIDPEVPRRRGLRAALRQRLTKVRLPK
jgi:hypothetical protein